ncbi:2Fe-2S iron-sulfur cluster-binding protein [Paenibacillus crassostreae]|uniref:Ferredoxin n=1 Tax=Paenibacillus crassostreae TaxID=1763538 RepID=A0A167DXK9_9BACL|nr:2Fe-2S iron-sulfur cluster-binding protein [Paenibacillus crassostreae]AOZ94564.1 ferredoxin [Paenibacillus crassostreae]OAB74895.1 ferredoxin [Paenibacillus crassostreae]
MDHVITFQPAGKIIKVRQGTNVLNAARKAGVYIPTRCEGKANCLMCKIKISEQYESALSSISDVEKRKLGASINEGIRLSCQTIILDDVEVTIPEDPLKAAIRKQLEAARNQEHDELW